MAHDYGTFDYKVINDSVKIALQARSEVDNGVQIAMPFVKATTTLQLDGVLGEQCIGFTLGLHNIEKDTEHEEIFGYKEDGPLIGYTYRPDGSVKLIYASNKSQGLAAASRLFDRQAGLVTSQYKHIPPPGITSCKIGRNKNGLLASADISFSVPSLIQLEVLHRTFLVPGIGMILEWGQLFGQEFGGLSQASIPSQYLFPWKDQIKLYNKLRRLSQHNIGLEEILRCHTYPTNGQYMWMFGRVANFKVNANGDGSYECSVKIVGPSEDSWAYSTRNTVVPLKDDSGKICIGGTLDINTYFSSTVANGLNFKTLLDAMVYYRGDDPRATSAPLPQFEKLRSWAYHVVKINRGNVTETEEKPDTKLPVALFQDCDDAYFITWRFFINVVLNDPDVGVLSIFKLSNLTEQALSRIGMVRSYQDTNGKDISALEPIDDPYESFVGYHQFLRSIDPSVLIINNPPAVNWAASEGRGPGEAERSFLDKVGEAATIAQSQGTVQPAVQRRNINSAINNKLIQPNGSTTFAFNLSTDAVIPELTEEQIQNAPRNPQMNSQFQSLSDVNILSPNSRFGTIDVNKISGIQKAAEKIIQESKKDRGLLSTGVWLNHKSVALSMVSADTLLRGIVTLLEKMNNATAGYWQLSVDPSDATPLNIVCTDEGIEVLGQNRFQYVVTDINYRENSEAAVNKFIDKVHIFNKYIRSDTTSGKILGSELIDCSIDLSLPKRMFAQIATLGLVQPGDLRKAGIFEDTEEKNGMSGPLLADPNEALREMFAITSLAVQSEFQQSPDLTIPPQVINQELQKTFGNCGSVMLGMTGNLQGNTFQGTPVWEDLAKLRNTLDSATTIKDLENFEKKLDKDILNKTKEVDDKDVKICDICRPAINAVKSKTVSQTSPTTEPPLIKDMNLLDPDFRARLDKLIQRMKTEYGHTVTVTETVRTQERQNYLYSIGRTRPGKQVTWTLNSNHKDGYAVDVIINGDYNNLVPYEQLYKIAPSEGLKTLYPQDSGHIELANKPTSGRPSVNTVLEQKTFAEEVSKLSKECQQCYYAEALKAQAAAKKQNSPDAKQSKLKDDQDTFKKQFPNLEGFWPLIEYQAPYMVASIANDANGNESNPFGASPGMLSIAADLKMPGISGFRVGELFWIDRVPAFYKAFGAFQIMSIEDTIDTNGWVTSIHARFNYLGNAWKKRMSKLLSTSLQDLTGETVPKG